MPRSKFYLQKVAKDCYRRMISELQDIEENIQFAECSIDEFRKVFAVIQAIGVLKMNKHFVSIMADRFNSPKFRLSNQNNVSIDMDYEVFIDCISWAADVPEEKIRTIVNLLVYDYSFHKNKVAIYQPIFKANSRIFFSSFLVYNSLPQDKFIYLMLRKGNNEPAISKIAKLREEKMTGEIIDFIKKRSELRMIANYIEYDNKKPIAEFDLLILDTNTKKILIAELKWFNKNDGEHDSSTINKKIIESMKIRMERFKIFENRKERIIKNSFGIENGSEFEARSCLISENYSGSSSIKDAIPIFDRFALYYSLNNVHFNLKVFFTTLDDSDYLPIPPWNVTFLDIDYHDQKYRIPVMSQP
jgi:hypothetical protein